MIIYVIQRYLQGKLLRVDPTTAGIKVWVRVGPDISADFNITNCGGDPTLPVLAADHVKDNGKRRASELQSAFRDEIYAFEGTLDKFMGDGVMALFGAPVAHEDDPARAIRSALGMQTALKRVNDALVTKHGITLQMRIGLNLGTVVVADIGAAIWRRPNIGGCARLKFQRAWTIMP